MRTVRLFCGLIFLLLPVLLAVLAAVIIHGEQSFSHRFYGPVQQCNPVSKGSAEAGGSPRRCSVARNGVVLITRYDGYTHDTALELANAGHIVIVGVGTETEKKAFEIYYGPDSPKGGLRGIECMVLDLSEPAHIQKVVQRVDDLHHQLGRPLSGLIVNAQLEPPVNSRPRGGKQRKGAAQRTDASATPSDPVSGSAVTEGMNVTDLDIHYTKILKGTTRLLQGLHPMIADNAHATRVFLLEDAETRLQLPTCGAKCIIADAMRSIFTQLRRQLTAARSSSTCTIVTVLRAGFGAGLHTFTPVDELSGRIWDTILQILYPKPAVGLFFKLKSQLAKMIGISSTGEGKPSTSTRRIYTTASAISVSGFGAMDYVSLDVGCYLASCDWFKYLSFSFMGAFDKTSTYSNTCSESRESCEGYSYVLAFPYDIFHIFYHSVFGESVQEELQRMISSS